MEDPLLKEDDPINTADTTSLVSGNDDDNAGVGIDGVPRRLEQDELTSDSNEGRSKRHSIPTLTFIAVPMVIFLALTFVAAAVLPPSPNPPTENDSPSSSMSNDPQNNNSKSEINTLASSDSHIVTTPTLLLMRDNNEGDDLLNAHDHQLYAQIKDASTFHYHAANSNFLTTIAKHGAKTLEPDKYEIEYGDSLTLAWSPREGDVDDEDIIAMYCPSFEVDPKKFRDVATLAQVKATHAIHATAHYHADKSVEMENNIWYIPSFPTVREDSCEFRLYSHSVNDASNQGNEGNEADLEQEEQQKHHYTFMATTGPISLTSNIVPTGIHLGLTGEDNEIIIQFVTGHAGEPLIEYSEKSDVRNSIELEQVQESSMVASRVSATKVKGESTTYVAADMCEAPATSTDPGFFISPGYLHKVTVGNLKAGVEYNYKVGLGFGQGIKWSDEYVLRGPTPRGATSSEERVKPALTFLALANQGCGESKYDTVLGADPPTSPVMASSHNNSAQDVADLISSLVDDDARTIDSVHHLGNLAYADGAAHVWDAYANMIQPYASRVPILVGVGNHDYDHSGGGGEDGKDPSGVMNMFNPPWGNGSFASTGGECGVPLSKRFAVPEGGNGVFWYSYEQSLVHTVMLSSEHNMTIGSSQYVWLQNDLAKVNRSITPWLVVEMHRPMYNSELVNWLNPIVSVGMQNEIEYLLNDYKTDLVLSGHYHSYFRSCNGLYAYNCDKGGPTYITVGTGGAPLDANTTSLIWPGLTEFFDREHFGVGRASVYNATSLHWEFVAVGGDVIDELWLTKD